MNLSQNYRPVTVLGVFSKLLEELTYDGRNNSYTEENILTNCECDFRKKRFN